MVSYSVFFFNHTNIRKYSRTHIHLYTHINRDIDKVFVIILSLLKEVDQLRLISGKEKQATHPRGLDCSVTQIVNILYREKN